MIPLLLFRRKMSWRTCFSFVVALTASRTAITMFGVDCARNSDKLDHRISDRSLDSKESKARRGVPKKFISNFSNKPPPGDDILSPNDHVEDDYFGIKNRQKRSLMSRSGSITSSLSGGPVTATSSFITDSLNEDTDDATDDAFDDESSESEINTMTFSGSESIKFPSFASALLDQRESEKHDEGVAMGTEKGELYDAYNQLHSLAQVSCLL
jgi:hypothetical protein